MRKDRIEERICGIERDVKDLRSEIRQELRSMMAGLKEFQELMIEDRIGEVQETATRQCCELAYDSAIENARKTFKEQLRYDCPPGDRRDECIDHFVDDHLRTYVAEVNSSSPEDVDATIQGICDRDGREPWRDNGSCAYCAKIYDAERDRLLAMGEKFTRYRQSLKKEKAGFYFKQLPDDLAVSEIVEPLSHKARFAMLKSLTTDGRSYKELGEVTGYNGGHLLYHVNKLVTAGMIAKEEDSGLYRITDKGMGVMEIVKKMYAC